MPPLGIQDLERRGTWRRSFAVADMVVPLVHPHYHMRYIFKRLGMSASLVSREQCDGVSFRLKESPSKFIVGWWDVAPRAIPCSKAAKTLPLEHAAASALALVRVSWKKSLVGLLTLRLEGFSADSQPQERINTFTASGCCSIFLAAPTALPPSIRYSQDRLLAIGSHGFHPHEAKGEAPGARV